MSDQEYVEALNQTKGIVIKRIEELERAAQAMLNRFYLYENEPTYRDMAALLEVNDE